MGLTSLASRYATGAADTFLDLLWLAAIGYLTGARDTYVERLGDCDIGFRCAGERHLRDRRFEAGGLKITRARHVREQLPDGAVEVHAGSAGCFDREGISGELMSGESARARQPATGQGRARYDSLDPVAGPCAAARIQSQLITAIRDLYIFLKVGIRGDAHGWSACLPFDLKRSGSVNRGKGRSGALFGGEVAVPTNRSVVVAASEQRNGNCADGKGQSVRESIHLVIGCAAMRCRIQKCFRWLRRTSVAWALSGVAATASAAPDFPAAIGTTWQYRMTQEFGNGVHAADTNVKADADGKVRMPLSMFVAPGEKIDGVDTVRLEMHRQGAVQLTEFVTVRNDGVTVFARSPVGGEIYKLSPPQVLLKLPPKVGEAFDYKGKAGEAKTEQHLELVAQEEVEVPAGKFSAYHLRISQDGVPKVVEDRWFVSGIGFVKITTLMAQPKTDRLIQRITLELMEKPKTAERPVVSNAPTDTRLLHGALATEARGQPTMTFKADVKNIFAQWQGDALKKNDKIRCVVTAERDGRKVEATTPAKEATDSGTFTFLAPGRSWPQGKYRAEFYVGEELADTVRFTVGK